VSTEPTTEQHTEQELEHAAEAISKEEGRGSLALWFAVLGSPIAWIGHLGLNYPLEEVFACSTSAEEEGEILGLGVDTVVVLANTAMLALALLSGLVAWRCRRKLRSVRTEDERGERARWMAFAGLVEAAFFTLVILLGYLPAVFLGTCETTP
jgi:hypothetical protein